jgi:hypothetical protein
VKPIRAFPCAVVALIAAICVVAAPASATTLVQAEDYPSEVIGESTNSHVFVAEDELKVTCKHASFSGTLSGPEEVLLVTPTYTECTGLGLSATVAANGCKYELRGGEEAGEGHFHGTTGVSCPAEKQITIAVATCEIQIPTQSGHSEVEFIDETKESKSDIAEKWNVKELKYTKAKDGFLCPLTGTGSKTDGTYQGDGQMQGKKNGNMQGMAMGKEIETILCEEQVKNNCKTPIKAKTPIKMEANTAATLEFVGNATTIGCPESVVTTTNEVEKKVTLPLENFAITFTNCIFQPGNKKCAKVNMTNKNPAAVLTASIFGPGSGILLTPITLFLECEGNSVTCEYKTDRALALVAGGAGGGVPGQTNFVGQALTKQALGGGMKEVGCSAVLSYLASYDIEEPEPIWVTQP